MIQSVFKWGRLSLNLMLNLEHRQTFFFSCFHNEIRNICCSCFYLFHSYWMFENMYTSKIRRYEVLVRITCLSFVLFQRICVMTIWFLRYSWVLFMYVKNINNVHYTQTLHSIYVVAGHGNWFCKRPGLRGQTPGQSTLDPQAPQWCTPRPWLTCTVVTMGAVTLATMGAVTLATWSRSQDSQVCSYTKYSLIFYQAWWSSILICVLFWTERFWLSCCWIL